MWRAQELVPARVRAVEADGSGFETEEHGRFDFADADVLFSCQETGEAAAPAARQNKAALSTPSRKSGEPSNPGKRRREAGGEDMGARKPALVQGDFVELYESDENAWPKFKVTKVNDASFRVDGVSQAIRYADEGDTWRRCLADPRVAALEERIASVDATELANEWFNREFAARQAADPRVTPRALCTMLEEELKHKGEMEALAREEKEKLTGLRERLVAARAALEAAEQAVDAALGMALEKRT